MTQHNNKTYWKACILIALIYTILLPQNSHSSPLLESNHSSPFQLNQFQLPSLPTFQFPHIPLPQAKGGKGMICTRIPTLCSPAPTPGPGAAYPTVPIPTPGPGPAAYPTIPIPTPGPGPAAYPTVPIPTPGPGPGPAAYPTVPTPSPGPGPSSTTTLDNTLCKVVNTLTGRAGKAVASIAVFFLGVGLFLGKMSWATALAIGLGISSIFGADTIIQWIGGQGASGPGCSVTAGGGTTLPPLSPSPGHGKPFAPPTKPGAGGGW